MDKSASIFNFLEAHKLGVISTVSAAGSPESALVAFTSDDSLCLYFQTKSTTRKAANLARNPEVACVIGTTMEDMATLQFEGRALQITAQDEIEKIKQLFIANDSPAKNFLEQPDIIFFKITPTWISFSDYNKKPPVIVELNGF